MGGRGSSGKASSGAGGSTQAYNEIQSNSSVVRNYTRISYEEAEKLFDAPVGTQVKISNHQEGDYIGELTKTNSGWVGSQKYKSSYKKPRDTNTAMGFAGLVVERDVKIVR